MANLVDKSGDATSNLVRGGTGTSLSFPMPGNVALDVESVVATIDNTAGTATTATLVVRDSSGEVVATKRMGETFPAGDTGTVTFSLRNSDSATRSGGIQFVVDNQGLWLQVTTTGKRPTTQLGIDVQATGGRLNLFSDQAVFLEGATLDLSADVGGTFLDSRQAFDMHVRNGVSEWDMDDGLAIVSSGNVTIQLAAGQFLEVTGTFGQPVFKVDANGDLHGQTGKALVFDL